MKKTAKEWAENWSGEDCKYDVGFDYPLWNTTTQTFDHDKAQVRVFKNRKEDFSFIIDDGGNITTDSEIKCEYLNLMYHMLFYN